MPGTSSSSSQHLRKRKPSLLGALVGIVALLATGLFAVIAPQVGAVTDPVSATMTASPNPVASGSLLTYTIVVTNREPQQTNVRLTDQLHGLTNIVMTSSRGYCTLSATTPDLVLCEAGSMGGHNETWTVTITGLVTAPNGTALSNTATITGNWSAQNTSQTYSVPVSTNVQVNNGPLGGQPDLSLSWVNPSTAAPASNQTYKLVVNNAGGSNVTDIEVVATLPSGITPANPSGTSLFNCSIGGVTTITCSGGAVNAGANATITIPVVISGNAPPPGGLTYKSSAVVDPKNLIPESNELNNTANHTLSVPASPPPTEPITFTKTAVSTVDQTGAQVRPGDTMTYTIKVTNTSPKQTATRVQITDGTQGLDQAAVGVTSSDPKLVCANSNAQVKCAATNNNYTLDAGKSVTVTVTGRVVQPPSSIITNTATLQTLQNKVSITRTASVTTIVRPPVDLTVTNYATCTPKSGEGSAPSLLPCGPFRARNQFDYLITVGNSGLNDAQGVTVRVPLPADVIYEGYANLTPNGGFVCDAPDGFNVTVVTCNLGQVPGQLSSASYQGTIRQLRLHLTAPNSTGPITAVTTVDPFNTIPETDEQNNTFTTTTPIATGVDLTITQAVRCPRDTRDGTGLMCDPVAPSGTLIYDILVTNVGTQDADEIKVSDILPAGTRFRSAKEVPNVFGAPYAPEHDLSCTSDGAQGVTCTGGELLGSYAAYGGPNLVPTGQFDNFTIEVVAFAPAPYGPNSSPTATGSPILNQVLVDPGNTIPEYKENNNLNILQTNVGIPGPSPATQPGDWGTFHELTVVNRQVNPVDGANNAVAVAPNGTLDYTLTISNWGSDPVSNLVVQDFVPTGARFRNVTAAPLANGTGGFKCAFADGVVTCTNGALASSPAVGTPTSTSITIRLFAPPTVNAATTQYTNHAVIDPANTVPEADETNNVSDVDLTVDLPAPNGAGKNTFNDLVIENRQSSPVDGDGKAVDVAPNGTLEYTLTVKNRGSDPVDGITFHDTVPVGSRFRAANSTPPANAGGFTCAYNAGVVQCGGGSLAGWSGMGDFPSAQVKILLFAPDAPTGATNNYTNHAIVDPGNTIPEGDETNNTQDISTIVSVGGANAYNQFTIQTEQKAPLKNGDPAHVAPSGTLVYRVNVENVGTDRATNVVVRDYLPAGTRFRSARLVQANSSPETTGFVCFHSNGVVDCTNGTLLSGGKAVIEIVLFAPADPVTINNQAVVDPSNAIPEGNEQDNTSVSPDTVVALDGIADFIELSISKLEDDPDPVGTDKPIKYTVDVKNDGTDDAFNVRLTDHLPAGTTFVSANDTTATTGGAFTCTESDGVVDCSGGYVKGNGGTRTIEIVALAPTQDDVTFIDNKVSLTNQVIVDPDNAIPEGDETNNVRSTVTTVKAVVDLEITKLTGSGSQGSDQGKWSWTVKNNGADAVTGVLVEVSLPIGVIPLDMTSIPAGWACQVTSNPINEVTCTGNLAGSGSADFEVRVYVAEDGTLHASAIVDPDDTIEETNEANNTKQSS
jgi:uncharacterized repeat protein (TIGR01451 family)/fimbrial isopeptide formation D2 family protein